MQGAMPISMATVGTAYTIKKDQRKHRGSFSFKIHGI